MEYLALRARWLPAHALALDPHARPCPSFSPRHLTRRVSTIGGYIIATSPYTTLWPKEEHTALAVWPLEDSLQTC
jgi:hypothetical protein